MARLVLFSEVSGAVVRSGVPVPDALVVQHHDWAWKSDQGVVRVKTDAEGKFHFPAVVRRSLLGALLPHEPLIRQTITVEHGGASYRVWSHDKGNYDERGELKGRPISLVCDLDAPLSHRG